MTSCASRFPLTAVQCFIRYSGRTNAPLLRRFKLHITKISAADYSNKCTVNFGNDPYIIKSKYPDIVVPNVPLHEYVWSKVDTWADKIAVECAITGRKYNYKEARTLTKRIASALQKTFKLKKGDCFAVLLPNIPEYPFFLLAASEAGLVATTINPVYKSAEISKQMSDCSAKVLITTPSFYQNGADAVTELKKDIPIVVVKDSEDAEVPKGGLSFDDLIKSSSDDVATTSFNIEDTVVLPYSSGTTGLPKGVQLSHKNLNANLVQMISPDVKLLVPTTDNQQDVILAILPMFHIYGMVVVALTSLCEGAKIVTLPKFEPKSFVDSIYNHKVTVLYLVPPIILFLGGHPDVKAEHLASVRIVNSGAAPIGESDVLRLREKAPHILTIQGYGMTESSPVVLFTSRERATKFAAAGVPLPSTEVKVVDVNTGKSLPAGENGELYVRGPQVMKGYLNREDSNAETLVDGWLRTGDLVHYDEDGDFFVTDRLKELIKVKGYQVPPAELEEVLRTHPKVSDAAVIGVKDERSGEVPRGFVSAKPGETIDPKEVAAYVASKVADYKQLTGGVVVLPSIPKSAAGKILRRELKEKFGDKI